MKYSGIQWGTKSFLSNWCFWQWKTIFLPKCLQRLATAIAYQHNNKTIKNTVESIPYHILLCDDFEEFLGGDIPLANNGRCWQDHHFDLLQDVERLREEPKLVYWIESAWRMTTVSKNISSASQIIFLSQLSLQKLW
jgi:hypothetical protein